MFITAKPCLFSAGLVTSLYLVLFLRYQAQLGGRKLLASIYFITV